MSTETEQKLRKLYKISNSLKQIKVKSFLSEILKRKVI